MIFQIILIGDSHEERHDPFDWARANCSSFRGVIVREGEFYLDDDEPVRFEYLFEQEHDATLFGLKFGSH